MAIRWFRTQHPQPVIGGGQGSGLHPAMWHAVLWNLAAFAMLALMFVWVRYKQAIVEHQLEEAHANASLYETEGAQ
jgi:heme exporter protein C